MDFFISDAYAQAGGPGGAPYGDILFLILLFAVFYFLLIRPQQKRAKEHKKMVEALSKGDEIVTTGGMLGKITDVGENFVSVQVAENVTIKVQRNAVANVMPKGTTRSD